MSAQNLRTVPFSDIEVRGELAVRTIRNYARLEGKGYRPEEVFVADQHGWPGDWEGRLILALSLLSQCSHRKATYLDEIVEKLPEHFNEQGYLGSILPKGCFDEQQMAGHSWLLRGLMEYQDLTENIAVEQWIKNILERLVLPARTHYAEYPICSENRLQDVWQLSKLQTKTKNHAESSDAGCAFILLDGATMAYERYLEQTKKCPGDKEWADKYLPQLRELIDEMIDRYMEMDFCRLHIQTHATLSASRGICRMYELTEEEKYLTAVEKIFQLYRQEAWSEAYGNYNWFGIPRWTEPCAIIDSFILAMNLWKITGKREYLDIGHLIYYNAIGHAQREEGCFGTDICTGAKNAEDMLYLKPVTYDVYWCCNMRGGELMAQAAQALAVTSEEDIFLPFYNDVCIRLSFLEGKIKLKEQTDYPYRGCVKIKVEYSSITKEKKLCLYVPKWAQNVCALKNGKKLSFGLEKGFAVIQTVFRTGDEFCLRFEQNVRCEETAFHNSVKGLYKYMYGPMLLGYESDGNMKAAISFKEPQFEQIGKSRFRIIGTEDELCALCDVTRPTTRESIYQILFRKEL